LEEVYSRIKKLRTNANMTLKDLSEATNLSVGFLSQVERGTTNLAISSLKKIADAFNINISEFFQDRKNDTYVTCNGQERVFQVKGLETVYASLGGNFEKKILAPYKLVMAPNQKKRDTFKFSGEEFYYVLKGHVQFTIDKQVYELNEGDAIHFPSNLEHYGVNLSSEESHLIGVITPGLF